MIFLFTYTFLGAKLQVRDLIYWRMYAEFMIRPTSHIIRLPELWAAKYNTILNSSDEMFFQENTKVRVKILQGRDSFKTMTFFGVETIKI